MIFGRPSKHEPWSKRRFDSVEEFAAWMHEWSVETFQQFYVYSYGKRCTTDDQRQYEYIHYKCVHHSCQLKTLHGTKAKLNCLAKTKIRLKWDTTGTVSWYQVHEVNTRHNHPTDKAHYNLNLALYRRRANEGYLPRAIVTVARPAIISKEITTAISAAAGQATTFTNTQTEAEAETDLTASTTSPLACVEQSTPSVQTVVSHSSTLNDESTRDREGALGQLPISESFIFPVNHATQLEFDEKFLDQTIDQLREHLIRNPSNEKIMKLSFLSFMWENNVEVTFQETRMLPVNEE